MKRSVCLIVVISMMMMKINARNIPAGDTGMLDDFIKTKVSIIKNKIVSDTLEKVFNGTFYKVDAGFSFSENGTYCSGALFAINNGDVVVLETRSDSMLALVSLIRKDFYLRNETDAKLFEECLDKIYPIDEMNEQYKQHLLEGNTWYFIRGKFFDSKSGYMVTLDKDSKIRNITYQMEAIKK